MIRGIDEATTISIAADLRAELGYSTHTRLACSRGVFGLVRFDLGTLWCGAKLLIPPGWAVDQKGCRQLGLDKGVITRWETLSLTGP